MSKQIQTKAEFQGLAETRLVEAKALLDLEMWDGAYYLAGYAVELALKACIIKMLMATDAFPEKDFSKECYVHSVEALVKLAKLVKQRKDATNVDSDLMSNWSTVVIWSEQKRYHQIPKTEATELYLAITDNEHGVLPWIKAQW